MTTRRALFTAPAAAAALAAAVLASAPEAAGAAVPVAVFPLPGALVASPHSQITFRGLPVWQLGSISVTGSRTGVHSGRIAGDSDGQGGSFLPSRPFAPNETVTVRTGLDIADAPSGTFSFRVADPAGPITPGSPFKLPPVKNATMSFVSRGDLRPPRVQITHAGGSPGDIFLGPQMPPAQTGAMILDPSGNLVFFKPAPRGRLDTDVRVQRLNGQPVLTWWQGYLNPFGVGVGADEILDTSYRRVAAVRAGNGLSADLHEFEITPQGTALITAYYPVYWDTSSVQGPRRAVVLDAVVQEIDIPTGLVLFQWDSLDHIPLSDTYVPPKSFPQQPFDFYHFNSAQEDRDGNLIISARNTWAAYKVDHRTGATIWRLGGRRSSFKLPFDAVFAFQHDVRVRSANDMFVTVFDDGAGPPVVHRHSRGLKLVLDFRHMTARVASDLGHAPSLLAAYEGNVQQLPGGDEFVGWGGQPYFTEYDARGRLVFDGRFATPDSSYRAFRFPWSAAPMYPPVAAALRSGSSMTVYASWNGATAVAYWRVLSGASPTSLQAGPVVRRSGFETAIPASAAAYAQVQAYDGAGQMLGQSHVVAAR